MNDGIVVPLVVGTRDSTEDAPLRRRRGRTRFCLHRRLELDEEARRVYCSDCEAEIPAFDALVKFSREFERWVIARDRARAEAVRASERLADLKRQERNAKARLRRRNA